MKCEACLGRGFIEKEAGLIQVKCLECAGTGEITELLLANQSRQEKRATFEGLVEEAHSLISEPREMPDDSISGDRRDNQSGGSPDTSKPKLHRKPKAKKKARARAG